MQKQAALRGGPDIGLPKSERIAQTLEREIRSGAIARGDQLASENQLVRRFSVSRNTVRKGLEQLVRQGLITTRTGIGSFVTYDGASIDNALGWTQALSKTTDQIETRLLGIERQKCSKTSEFLGLEPIEFLCVNRLRVLCKNGTGISLERSRTPWRDVFSDVVENGLINDSLGETLAGAGLAIHDGEEWAQVLPSLSTADAKIMVRTPGEPMLHLRRVSRTVDGDVIEFVESILDPSRFGLHLEF
ncbi:MAG: GntR family transcriptional regulator [Hyphomicrobiales bacterium]|nr:GntR family transcriptional regulator [Hyphomicrobiales bacterium]MCP4998246.1 GntR family transcriptional regulator [Hyphomicrobiales bacterium]